MYPGTYAATDPDKPAVVMTGSGAMTTFAELERSSARLARYLQQQGMRRGDTIALLAENSPRAFEVYWAARRSGLYITVVNHHLAPAEIGYIIANSGARVLIVSIDAEVTALTSDIYAELPVGIQRLAAGGNIDGFTDLDTELAHVSCEPLPDQPRGAPMLYSSGTTGRPKGIKPPLPEEQIDEPGDIFVETFGPMYDFGADTVYLSPAPLYHAAPLYFCATVQALGGTVVAMERFDAEDALAAIEDYRVTHTQWVPTMFVRALKLPREYRESYDVSSLRVAIHAAAPCPVDVKNAMIEWWGQILHEYYGSTEGNGITFIDSLEWIERPGSVGRAGLGTIRVCLDDGNECPPGQVGTIYFERDHIPFVYHNDPDTTYRAQHPVHPTWTTTGDIGYVDEAGYLFLTGRKDFVIISGGVNIYPQEVEDCLVLHPAVFDVGVIGLPDAEMGQSVAAVVVPATGAVPGPELAVELRNHARERIAHYKAPKKVEFTDALPRTPTGKLVKRTLEERYSSESSA